MARGLIVVLLALVVAPSAPAQPKQVKPDRAAINRLLDEFIPAVVEQKDLKRGWEASAAYAPFRNYVDTAEEPCRSCPYLRTCRGGCRAVALFLTRRDDAPDPECPRVEDHQRARL